MANQIIVKQFQKALALWPKDPIRPNHQFQDVLRKRIEGGGGAGGAGSRPPSEADVNALFSLLENRYTKRYTLQPSTMQPASNPEYYKALVKEIHEAPKRSWLGRYVNSWKGFLRWK